MNRERLAGRFSLLVKDENSIIVGFVGNVTSESLTYEEIRYIATFYTDGKFVINAVNVLDKTARITNTRFPQNNCNSILRICITKLDRNIPDDEYCALKMEEERLGIEVRRAALRAEGGTV